MGMFVRLRLAELLENRKITQAKLGRRTGLSEDRVSRLVRNGWAKLSRGEIGRLLHALQATPAELFEVHEPTVFFGARRNGPLKIHVSMRWLVGDERARNGPPRANKSIHPLTVNGRDIEAFKLVQDYTRKLGIQAELVTHTPGSMDPARFQELVDSGNHVIIGSNLTGELSEYALTHMYGAPAFDGSCLQRFPFTFSWGVNRSIESSFGFEGEKRNLGEGIYSTQKKEIVATRTHTSGGAGHDCGLIAVYRVESPPEDDLHGIRRERCVIVLAGHGRHGTLGCARVLVEAGYQERLYPAQERLPKMFVVQVRYLRHRSLAIPTTYEVSTLGQADIVAEA